MPSPATGARRLCLITGASAGIGAAFAKLYASRGYDLALTARREDRLVVIADDVARRHQVETLVIPADLSDPAASDHILGRIAASGRQVDALVNNAGYGLTGGYAGRGWPDQAAMLQVMLTAPCELAHKTLPGMTGQGCGRIINVASLAGLMPGYAGHTLYVPIKAFLVKLSQALRAEARGTGVHVTALCPGLTYTEFHDVNHTRADLAQRTPSWLWQGADVVAAAGFSAVEANRAICIPGLPNKAVAALCRILPDAWIMALMSRAQADGDEGAGLNSTAGRPR